MNRTTPEFLSHDGPIAYAHRGGDLCGVEKQNTLAAFQAAYNLGFRYAETDVVCTTDGLVVVSHGSRSRRDQARTGLPLRSWLQSMTYAELIGKVTAGGEKIPLLDELFASFPDMRLNIEPKTDKVVVPLGTLIAKHNVLSRVCIASFRYKHTRGVVERIRELKGTSARVCTVAGPAGSLAVAAGLRSYVRRTEFDCLQLPYRRTTAGIVERAHEMGLKVHVWTPNDEESITQSLEVGVDGIMSDKIRLLKESIERWNGTNR
jgi:glycerophosphoryl diester phosphodiesterase